jgi:hypothetical protein
MAAGTAALYSHQSRVSCFFCFVFVYGDTCLLGFAKLFSDTAQCKKKFQTVFSPEISVVYHQQADG